MQEGPRTQPPDAPVFRFFSRQGEIFIRCEPPAQGSGAEWTIDAQTPDALYELAKAVWPYHGRAALLEPRSHSDQANREGWSVLERLRQEFPPGPGEPSGPRKTTRWSWKFW